MEYTLLNGTYLSESGNARQYQTPNAYLAEFEGPINTVASDTIVFDEVVSAIKRSFSASDTITFNENVVVNIIQRVSDTITFSEVIVATTTSIIEELTTFVETATKSITVNKNVNETLNLVENAARLIISNKSNSETLTFSEVIGHQKVLAPLSVAELLSLSEVVVNFKAKLVAESLTFNEVTTFQRVHVVSVNEILNFNEVVSRINTYVRNITEQLILQGGMLKPSGFGGEIFIPEVQYVKIGKKCAVVLESTTNNSVIVLPCPIFGDTEANLNTTVIKRSMNNKLYTYSRRNDLQQLNYTFIMGKGKARQLQTFVEDNIAKTIVLLNWKGERWYMKMVNNPFEFTPQSLFENEAEKYEVSLEFKGVRVF